MASRDEPAARGADREQERGERLAGLADGGDDAAVDEVEHLAGDDRHRNQRKELDQADEPEIERVAGEIVDLPADRHALHHEGAVGEGARHQNSTNERWRVRCVELAAGSDIELSSRRGRACHRKSGLPDLRHFMCMRNSGRPELRCHPRL